MNNVEFILDYDRPRKVRLVPVIIVDDAHLCKESFDVMGEWKVVQIYPTQYSMPREVTNKSYYILPFRFVEVIEVLPKSIVGIDIRSVLSNELKHYGGVDRYDNLRSPSKICDIIKKLHSTFPDISSLQRLFRLYALYGGSALGIELISKSWSGKLGRPSWFLSDYMKTIDKVIQDADTLGVNRLAVKHLLYYLSDISQGFQIDLNSYKQKVRNRAARDGVRIEDGDIEVAFGFLRQSLILGKFRLDDRGEEYSKAGNYAKVFLWIRDTSWARI
jgi:hypothetical protein